jgi:hypothetical protein
MATDKNDRHGRYHLALPLRISSNSMLFAVKAFISLHPEKYAWPRRKNFPDTHSELQKHGQ